MQSQARKHLCLKPVTDVDSSTQTTIRETIYEMYGEKQHITLKTLLTKLNDKEIFKGSEASLRRILKKLGFKWLKYNPRRGLLELNHIAFKRIDFLRSYIENRNDALYQFVFLDETWIFQDGTIGRSLQNDDVRSVKTTKTNGKRNKPSKSYIADKLALTMGHKLLRLPPYHCMFNPIEHVWGIAKLYYNNHVGLDGRSTEHCIALWRESLAIVTPERWSDCVRHTEKEMLECWDREKRLDAVDVAPLIINTPDSSDESELESYE